MTDDILDAEQVALLLRCEKAKVEELARTGELPGTKYGRSWIFVHSQIIATVCEKITSERQPAGRPGNNSLTPMTGRKSATVDPDIRLLPCMSQ